MDEVYLTVLAPYDPPDDDLWRHARLLYGREPPTDWETAARRRDDYNDTFDGCSSPPLEYAHVVPLSEWALYHTETPWAAPAP